jgi:hypothetical protein
MRSTLAIERVSDPNALQTLLQNKNKDRKIITFISSQYFKLNKQKTSTHFLQAVD